MESDPAWVYNGLEWDWPKSPGASRTHTTSQHSSLLLHPIWSEMLCHTLKTRFSLLYSLQSSIYWKLYNAAKTFVDIIAAAGQWPLAFDHFWTLPPIGVSGQMKAVKSEIGRTKWEFDQTNVGKCSKMYKCGDEGACHIWKENNFQKPVMPKFTRECLRRGRPPST